MFRVFRDVKTQKYKNKKKKKLVKTVDQEFSLYYVFTTERENKSELKNSIALVLSSQEFGLWAQKNAKRHRKEGGGQEAQGPLSPRCRVLSWAILTLH